MSGNTRSLRSRRRSVAGVKRSAVKRSAAGGKRRCSSKKSKQGVVAGGTRRYISKKTGRRSAAKAENAAARKAAKAKKDAAQAKKAAVQEAAQAEKRMKEGMAARPGSRAHTRFLQEYYKPEVVKAREENAAARRKAGHFGQASK